MKVKLPLPPHLYSATTLPSKTQKVYRATAEFLTCDASIQLRSPSTRRNSLYITTATSNSTDIPARYSLATAITALQLISDIRVFRASS